MQNRLSIEMRERALSTEEMACKALTCAKEEGRKTGLLIHPYSRYVRVLRSGHYDVTLQPAGSNKVPPSLSLPWLHLSRSGQMHHGDAETETAGLEPLKGKSAVHELCKKPHTIAFIDKWRLPIELATETDARHVLVNASGDA
jgi:hypothetical protein